MMKVKTGLAAVAVASMGLWASVAHAATLQIGAEANGVVCNALCFIAGPTTGASPLTVATVGSVAVGSFGVQASSTASSNGVGLNFGSNTIDVVNNGSAPGTLKVWVTLSNLTTGAGQSLAFLSGFTSNILPAGWTIQEQTFLDTGNHIFDLGAITQLATATFTATGGSTPNGISQNVGPGPYSLTELFTITDPSCNDVSGSCQADSTIHLAAAVPGPIVGAGLPGLLAACGGLIAFARRRRRQLA